MRRALLIACPLLAAFVLAGCAEVEKSSSAASKTVQKAEQLQAESVAAPRAVELTDQKRVWECPTCGTDYDRPGDCPMDKTKLTAMDVSYVCTAENQPVDRAGTCPRCGASVRADKTPATQ
jgi:rubrerythrin